ncbi:hypothetical protein [Desulfosediminicola flagellatus]|uniref:hypothetical protein n=1 Tax=Desulfosediminicola flagellatus TaxID=2569541 RepID=UPI0010AD211A|nr:hypothetical protein [Desulfosediminicola flagellatus]
MFTMAKTHRQILLATSMLFFAVPMVACGSSTGHDWYCPDQEAHKDYEEHFKEHHLKDTAVIADILETIYADGSLNVEQRKEKTTEVLNNYLAKSKLGIGD